MQLATEAGNVKGSRSFKYVQDSVKSLGNLAYTRYSVSFVKCILRSAPSAWPRYDLNTLHPLY